MKTNSEGRKHNQDQNRVVLFGESLFLDTVEAILDDYQGIEAVRIDASATDFREQFRVVEPDLIILDLNTPQFQSVVVLLRDQPGIPVLCLDVTCSKVVTLSSQQHTPLTVENLTHIVQTQASGTNGNGTQVCALWHNH